MDELEFLNKFKSTLISFGLNEEQIEEVDMIVYDHIKRMQKSAYEDGYYNGLYNWKHGGFT